MPHLRYSGKIVQSTAPMILPTFYGERFASWRGKAVNEGFTGMRFDKLDRRICYESGRRVPCLKQGKDIIDRRRKERLDAGVQKGLDAANAYRDGEIDATTMLASLEGLTRDQLRGVREGLGVDKRDGLKKDLAEKINKAALGLRDEQRWRQTNQEIREQVEIEEQGPIGAYQDTVVKALEKVAGDKAEAIAEQIGLSLERYEMERNISQQLGIPFDDAKLLGDKVRAELVEYLEKEGIPVPQHVKEEVQLTPEEIKAKSEEETRRWQEREAKEVTEAKEFAEKHWQNPPPPDTVTSKQWILMKMLQRLNPLKKDYEKIKDLEDRRVAIEATWKTDPDYQKKFDAWVKERDKPAMKRLLKKYRPDWMAKKDKGVNSFAALDEVARQFHNVNYEWEGSKNYVVSSYGQGAIDHAEHMEAIKAAVNDDTKTVPEHIMAEFLYESWVPKKYQDRRITKAMVDAHASYMEKEHAYYDAFLQKALDRAEPKLRPLMDRAKENAERSRVAVDNAKAEAKTALDNWTAAIRRKNDFKQVHGIDYGGTNVPEPLKEKHERLVRELREAIVDYQQKSEHSDRVRDQESKRFLEGLLPGHGNNEIEFEGGGHMDDQSKVDLGKATTFLQQAVSGKWGKIPASVEPLGEHSRACAGGGKIYTSASESASTMVHEYGHLIEHKRGGTLGSLSRAFAMRAVKAAGETPKHLGSQYEAREVGAKDSFQDNYTGKFYTHRSSEVLSMGVQNLHDDPIRFYKEAPEHFRYTLACLHKLLT